MLLLLITVSAEGCDSVNGTGRWSNGGEVEVDSAVERVLPVDLYGDLCFVFRYRGW